MEANHERLSVNLDVKLVQEIKPIARFTALMRMI